MDKQTLVEIGGYKPDKRLNGEGAYHAAGISDLGSLIFYCEIWLKDRFGIKGVVTSARVISQELIDKTLGLLPIEFTYTDFKGNEGSGTAFLETR